MTPTVALERVGRVFVVMVVVAASFTAVAWRVRRSRNLNGLIVLWLTATLLITAIATASAVRYVGYYREPTMRDVVEFVSLYFLVFFWGLGAVTWRVHRKLRLEPAIALTFGRVLRGVVVFFVSLFVLALPLLVWDASRLF